MKNLITLLFVLVSVIGMTQDFKPTDKFYYLDSTNLPYVESLIAERVNMYRKEKGLSPLVWNDTLKPMCDHHSYYMTHAHDMDHYQTKDLPNFVELDGPSSRSMLNMVSYGNIREELTSDMFGIKDGMTYNDYIYRQIEDGFMGSQSHWRALMDPELDYIYVDVMDTDPNAKSEKGKFVMGTFTMIVMCEDIYSWQLCDSFYDDKQEIVNKYKNNPYCKAICLK